MAILLVFAAAAFVAISNLFMRKSVDAGGSSKGFILFQTLVAFLTAILISPVRTGDYAFNFSIAIFGILAGLALSFMLFCLGRAVEKGPPGITFSILNAAAVMPGLLMALLFGAGFGFLFNAWHAIGSILVLGGLFWAGKGMGLMVDKKTWILFSVGMFTLHVVVLTFFQCRALLLNLPHPEDLVSFFTSEEIRSQWFMPFMYGSAALVQLTIYLRHEKSPLKSQSVFYGSFGGVANSLCTFFLIWAAEVASPLENAVIFPVFSVAGIVLSNMWSQRLYQESVNWKACQLCVGGILIGTVDWKGVAAAIGF
ncbi:MAG: hypothetical protein V4487_05580 [Chlamydiota bacterium]